MRFLAILTALCLLCLTAPVAYADYDEEECSGNGCDAPPENSGGSGGDSISEAQAEAIARAVARAISRSNSSSEAGAEANNELNIDASDASDYPGTPASVYATRCTNGASVSFPGGGATATANDKFCNRLALAAFYAQVLNDSNKAKEIVVIAEDRLNRSGRLFGIPRFFHLDEIPLVGPFLFSN